jgi:hypothetical protein
MPRPILFLDTNVCINVAKERIAPDSWAKAQRYISRNFEYRISPHTVVELLIGLQRGKPEFFEENQRNLKALASIGGDPAILPFPGAYAAQVVLQLKVTPAPNSSPADVRRWLLVVIRAKEAADLSKGVEIPGITRALATLDLSQMEVQLQVAKDQHSTRLQRARSENRPVPTREEWGHLLGDVGVHLENDAEARRVTDALDAAYVLDSELFQLARSNTYDFARHDTDYLDMNQLYYLCNPRMHMLTEEVNLPRRVQASPQRTRILRVGDILSMAASAEKAARS